MEPVLTIALACVGAAVLGYLYIRRAMRHDLAVKARISAFLKALSVYVKSAGADVEAYTDLLALSTLLQSDLGSDALVDFKPAFSRSVVSNYPALVNHVPAMHYEFNIARFKDQHSIAVYATGLQEILLRAETWIDQRLLANHSRLRNPVALFLAGVQAILMIPLGLLVLAGALPGQRAYEFSRRPFVRVASVLVAFLSVIASVITIVTGWPQITMAIRGWFGR